MLYGLMTKNDLFTSLARSPYYIILYIIIYNIPIFVISTMSQDYFYSSEKGAIVVTHNDVIIIFFFIRL